jgi:aconitase B
MADTLGSLCDKLTVIKLKQWHSNDPERQDSLAGQERRLREEIDEYVASAVSGKLTLESLTFASNKIYKKDGNMVADVVGSIGDVLSRLAAVNCALWHEQEKVYDFANVPDCEKNVVVKQLSLLNLERNNCIDQIDQQFRRLVEAAARVP